MNWLKQDVLKYHEAKEYIDTIILPLAPISLTSANASKLAADTEVLHVLSQEIERNLSGRLFKLPIYHYISDKHLDNEVERIIAWQSSYESLPFKHQFYLTFDMNWRKHEKDLPGTVIWIPSFSSFELNSVEFEKLLSENVAEIMTLMQTFW